MDKVIQALFAAEFGKLVQHDGSTLAALDGKLMELFKAHHFRLDVPFVQRRVRALKELPERPAADHQYISTFGVRGVMRYPLPGGRALYKVPVFSFAMNSWKDHWTAVYLIAGRGSLTLVDTGTHLSEQSMREGLAVVRDFYGEPVALEQVDDVVITHAHFDHFGGLTFVLPASGARLLIHEWDAGTLINYPQELQQGRERIRQFLRQSGMPAEEMETFMRMHSDSKRTVAGFPVHQAFRDHDRIVEGLQVIHTPGHCPGLSCFRIGDLMLLGDQVLNTVTPHQFPKIYTSGSGLHNYMRSLIKIAACSEGVRLGLPSHYGDIPDIEARAMEIMGEHNQRMTDLLKDMDVPKSLHQITNDYYRFRRGREITGYEQLLALEEIGAHIEYMQETLGIVKQAPGDAPAPAPDSVLRYQRTI